MTKTIAVAGLALSLAAGLLSVSCAKKAEVKGVELTVGFAEKDLTDNLITDVQYRWKTGPDFVKLDKDYNVFVHFWHGTNLLFQDDYVPNPPTSAWRANQDYRIVRRIHIPAFIDVFDPQFKGEETLRVAVGLYSPYDRSGKSKIDLYERKLKVTPPPPDTPEIVYEDGWYDLETNPDSYLKSWRWMGKEARCLIDNPNRDALLVVRGGINRDAQKDPKITVKINDTVLDEFVPTETFFEKAYEVKKDQLGTKKEFYLTLAVDKTFVPEKVTPGSKDTRELGAQISLVYFR